MMDSTKRFSNRVEDYVKYRPGYPVEIVEYLEKEYGLSTDKIIADVGAGTGISSTLFLNAGYRVIAVEPNKEMREKAVSLLNGFAGFKAVDGTAEDTNLEDKSVDAIIAGQAFHWFDKERAKPEFKRILKENGMVALVWNERLIESDFEKEYEQLIIKHGKDYVQVDHRNINSADIDVFYNPQHVELHIFKNKQIFDFDGLKGRLLSSSYMPAYGQEGFDEMMKDLEMLFNRHKENDFIRINYSTKLYVGNL